MRTMAPLAGPGAQQGPDPVADNYGGLDSGFLFSTVVERDSREVLGGSTSTTADFVSTRGSTSQRPAQMRGPGQRATDSASGSDARDHLPLFF